MHAGDMFSLAGKVAVVTGGRGLYGAPLCEGLAETGAHVVVASRDGAACAGFAQSLCEKGLLACGAALDLASDASIEAFTAWLREEFGRVDILVNNAVTRDGYTDLGLAEREKINHTLDINISGAMLLTKHIVALMRENGGGSIINISSIQGVMGPHFPYYEEGQTSPAGYTIEKWGMVGFTKWLCAAYGRDNIRANCISPGGYDPKLQEMRPRFYRTYAEHTPLGRWPDRDDIKGPAVFLASEASRYVTGLNLVMDGGFTVW